MTEALNWFKRSWPILLALVVVFLGLLFFAWLIREATHSGDRSTCAQAVVYALQDPSATRAVGITAYRTCLAQKGWTD